MLKFAWYSVHSNPHMQNAANYLASGGMSAAGGHRVNVPIVLEEHLLDLAVVFFAIDNVRNLCR
mgnify:CR=1 FL=1